MKKARHGIAFLLVCALLLTTFTACGAPSTSSGTGTPEGSSPASETTAEPMKLQMLFDEAYAEFVDMKAPIVKELESRYNVVFEPVYFASANNGFGEWLTTRIAGDEFPDMFFNSSQGGSEIADLIDQGLIAELPIEKIKEKCPDIFAWTQKYKDIYNGVDLWDYFDVDGKYYALPYAWYEGANRNLVALRGDWLKKVGITKTPETVEEYEEAMRLFTEGDPDGNGKKDTYGYSHINDPVFGFNWIYPAFGTNPQHFDVDKNGKVTRGEVEPGSKQALEVLNRWYKLGYIDPEWVTNGWGEAQNKVLSGISGITWQGYPAFCDWDGSYIKKLVEVNPDAYYEMSPGPKGPQGLAGCVQFNPVNGGGMVFNVDLPEEKLNKYLEIVNDLSFDKELQLLLHRGIEGTHYKKTEKGYEWIAPYDDLQTRQGAGFDREDGFGIYTLTSAGCFRDGTFQDEIFYTKDQLAVKREMEALTSGSIDLLAPFAFEASKKSGEALGRMTTEAYTKFITGERSLDEFDAYVTEWMNAGGADLIKEAQAKYDATLKPK